MSESTIPFQGQTAALDRPGTGPDPAGDGANRTRLLAVGGAAAVLVLGVVAYFLLFAGGDAEQVVAPPSRSVAPVPSPGPVIDTVTQPILSNKAFGKDPFKALIDDAEAVAAADIAPAVTTTATTTTTDPLAPATSTGTTDPTTTGKEPATTIPTASTAHTFKVVEVAPDNSTVTVKVDGVIYPKLIAGEVFATYFKVVLISGQVNAFQFGEEKFNVVGTKRLTIA